jgi:hypothetical protein
MEADRFDTLVKTLGRGTSRRRVLRGLLGSSVAGAAVVSQRVAVTAAKACTSGSECPKNQICGFHHNPRCVACTNATVACKAAPDRGQCCLASQHCCACPDSVSGSGTISRCFDKDGDDGPQECADFSCTPG